MNRLIKNIILLFYLTLAVFSARSENNGQLRLFLFTDRDYCVSGDSIWFKVKLANENGHSGNIVHVQLDSPKNNLITAVMVKSLNGWAEGFIAVPDSVSSGIYFISAYLNAQRNRDDLQQFYRSLFVYNRFENEVVQLPVPQQAYRRIPVSSEKNMLVSTGKSVFSPHEKVRVKLNVNPEFFSDVVVKASVLDPFSDEYGGVIETAAKTSAGEHEFPAEKNGFVLTGNVTNNLNGESASGVIVLISVAREVPYFDYCVTDHLGRFSFFLKNAVGTATIYLQTMAQDENQYSIQLEENYLAREKTIEHQIQMLSSKQTNFIKSAIDGVFFQKVFNGIYQVQEKIFLMPPQFAFPFYGESDERVIPAEYVHLTDFREISRELLPGIQFRETNGEATLRVLNSNQRMFFDSEPLRLLNGIPVFDNNLLKPLDSDDIEYIDFVFKQRLYGDLVFNGAIAISLTNKTNNWLASQQKIQQFEIDCLQLPKKPGYNKVKDVGDNIPDTRTIFCWKTVQAGKSKEIEFELSDVKGLVEIAAEGTDKDGTRIKASTVIEVR